jgi:nucleoside-diphosphate-sugar epimerase
MKRLLIAGCGDLGIRLAQRLSPSRWHCTGMRRQTDALPESIQACRADLSKPETLDQAAGQWDAMVYQVTPSARTPEAYRQAYVTGLTNLLARIQCQRLIFVSSTAVYGQQAGEWVDEQSATEPEMFNGRILLEAEKLALGRGGVVVRFSGIYGPGRDYLLRQLRTGQATCRAGSPQWTNRIHAEDCAGVLAHVLEIDDPAPVYCASDCLPVDRCEVLTWLARQMEVPPPVATDDEGADQGKRVSNRQLLASGYQFEYPDYKTGYGAMLT